MADGLGERRDRDVAIAALHDFSDQMMAPDRRGISSLIDRFRDEQAEANLALAPLVEEQNLGRDPREPRRARRGGSGGGPW